jgi:hypothetical protein
MVSPIKLRASGAMRHVVFRADLAEQRCGRFKNGARGGFFCPADATLWKDKFGVGTFAVVAFYARIVRFSSCGTPNKRPCQDRRSTIELKEQVNG